MILGFSPQGFDLYISNVLEIDNHPMTPTGPPKMGPQEATTSSLNPSKTNPSKYLDFFYSQENTRKTWNTDFILLCQNFIGL